MDDRLFRDAMGTFATGVTVLTTKTEDGIHGMTANAFMSVSLDPKLIVVSVGHRARFLDKVKESKKFAVNILAKDQVELSNIFAGQKKDEVEVKFDEFAGLPVLPGALAQVTCEVAGEHVEGDHTLFIGKVTDIQLNDGDPLLFYKGKYREIK